MSSRRAFLTSLHPKNGDRIKPEEFSIKILLPHYVIEELKDVAKYHDATLEEEITRAALKYHA